MLYVIPIEPLEERYSEQWLRWTKAYLKKQAMLSAKGHLRLKVLFKMRVMLLVRLLWAYALKLQVL